jgi:hypothetical protein
MYLAVRALTIDSTQGRTRSLLAGVPSDRSSELILLPEGAVFSALDVALGLSLLVLSVTLSTAFLARGLPALETSHVADGLLGLAQGVLHLSGSLAKEQINSWSPNEPQL